jgi:hypothetical protein
MFHLEFCFVCSKMRKSIPPSPNPNYPNFKKIKIVPLINLYIWLQLFNVCPKLTLLYGYQITWHVTRGETHCCFTNIIIALAIPQPLPSIQCSFRLIFNFKTQNNSLIFSNLNIKQPWFKRWQMVANWTIFSLDSKGTPNCNKLQRLFSNVCKQKSNLIFAFIKSLLKNKFPTTKLT